MYRRRNSGAFEALESDSIWQYLQLYARSLEVRVPDELVLALDTRSLPANWQDPGGPTATADIGDRWLECGASVTLKVPSAVLPLESNLLLSPLHPDFAIVEAQPAMAFALDPGLVGRASDERTPE